MAEITEPLSSSSIENWLTEYLQAHCQVSNDIDIENEFDQLGLDSAAAVKMVGDLEDFIGHELSPSIPYQYPTIKKLAIYLASLACKK